MTIHEKLGDVVLQSLAEVTRKKGDINMADIGAVLERISVEMNQMSNDNNKKMLTEVKQLAEILERTKQEMLSSSNNSAADATLHLEAIIHNTEEAGHKIIDAVSAIQEVATSVGGEAQAKIDAEITKIYEACNFQDLTTQRINKVIKILDNVSHRINNMLKLFGAEAVANSSEEESSLLNGPQLPSNAPNQNDIDALFSSL